MRIARQSGAALVTFSKYDELYASATRRIYSRLFDAQYRPLTEVFPWQGEIDNYYYDAAIDDLGRFALAWPAYDQCTERIHVSFYDAQVAHVGHELVMNPEHECDSAFRIALHPTSGAGAVSCQGQYDSPIYVRRFSAQRAWLDTNPVQIDDGSNDSSWYQSHILGMNAAGELVIQWQRSVAPAGIRARFYTPDGSLLKTVELCPMYREDDAFRSRHVAAVVMGSDFLRFDGFDPGKVWRFSGQGEPLGCCRLPPGLKAGARLRSDGLGLLYLRDSGDAVKLVTLDFAQGCN